MIQYLSDHFIGVIILSFSIFTALMLIDLKLGIGKIKHLLEVKRDESK